MAILKPKRYYPLGLDISGRECLVVGGGKVAERKIRRLLEYGARVRVVSPDLTPGLTGWAAARKFRYRRAKFSSRLLQKPVLVFAATNDAALNERIIRSAARKGIFTNAAKPGKASGFIVPALIKRSSFTIAISTEGRSPGTAKKIREKLEKIL
jgi:precorrin-2 dehydrogenase/sirohydrochlorin ferrochelatase